MRYISTRNKSISVSSSKAIIQGISTDGGLFVPSNLPKIYLKDILDMDYKELAFSIMSKFLTDFEPNVLKECIEKAYDEKFDTDIIAPLAEVGDSFFLELYHGPTLAFKDMALSILPHLLKAAMKINEIQDEVVILTATSGDTGKAALEGFANVEGIKIIVFYPENGVSEIQKRQMITQEGENTFVIGINGNFDDAQNGVKELFNNKDFIKTLKENNYILSSANSINIGRLIPQIVYYFHSYLTLLKSRRIDESEMINIAVPTGNFGNILAAYYAKKMGLPVNKLICASNENNILTEFLNSGIYDKRRELKLTSSPSMDILVSSNLERLLFHLSDEDDLLIDKNMKQLSKDGYYKMDNLDFDLFYGGYSTEEEVSTAIRNVFLDYNYLLDTHTAVAYKVYEKYKSKTKDSSKTIIASTASPFKFGTKVAFSVGLDVEGLDEFSIIDNLGKKANLKVPKAINDLKNKTVIHTSKCSIEDMKQLVEKILKVGGEND